MLDKSISLLKDNGYLAIVLPDAVFSAKGTYAEYRDALLKNVLIKAVFELPPVTFAQAGTRTNTCVLYAKKEKVKEHSIFMSICNDVGYIVKERGGAPVKIKSGKNEMEEISELIIHSGLCNGIVNESPSVTLISSKDLIENSLNPTFYAADRLKTIKKLASINGEDLKVRPLSELADFVTKTRKGKMVSDEIKHISVLHINADTTISFKEVMEFNPVCKGRECHEGDVIFSKINPRIQRMAVIPKSDYQLVCSNEFEILRPKEGVDPYVLCHLLRTEMVKNQIVNLTSGTSSSHNRIKTEQLMEIELPIRTDAEFYKNSAKELKEATEAIYKSERIIENALNRFDLVE